MGGGGGLLLEFYGMRFESDYFIVWFASFVIGQRNFFKDCQLKTTLIRATGRYFHLVQFVQV